MGMDFLSGLPSELICAILSQLDSLDDLFSIIRASPRIYTGAFADSRELVLRHVVQNVFKPATLSDALIAVRFSSVNAPLKPTRGDFNHKIYRERLVFLARLFKEAKAGQQPCPTLAESVALCQLVRSFDTFAQDCCRQFLATAEWEVARKSETGQTRRATHNDLQKPFTLSRTELGRLRRGFLRYITIQSLIHPFVPGVDGGLSSQDITTLFANFTPWEIEEIACVHQYTIDWLRKVLEEVEDDFVESVTTAEGPSRWRFLPDGENKRASLSSLEAETPFISNFEDEVGPDGVSWQESDDVAGSSTAMFLKSEKDMMPQLIEHLATLPFNCFRTLVQSNNLQRRSIINHNSHWRLDNLDKAMRCGISPEPLYHFFQEEHQGRQRRQKLEFEGDDLHKRNLAWLWAHQMMPYPGYYDRCDMDLRAWGYVFWDEDRLKRMGLLEESRPFRYPLSRPPHYPQPQSRPSAQERLRDLGLA